MYQVIGSLVVPVRTPFHLDPIGNPSVENRGFLWPRNQIGIIVELDVGLGASGDPWVAVMVNSKLGHCLFSELDIL